jgi:hypothetical protein
MLFPSHVKRIILCFVYSETYHSSCIYTTLEEESLQPACIVEVDSTALPQPIHKDEHCIQIPFESDQPYNSVEIEIDSKPTQTSVPAVITAETFHQPLIPHEQPTSFQTKIRMKMFKPLRLPYPLHPYPLDCYEYLPQFSGENQVSAERHLEFFENFVDRFQIIHEDVIMRFFSKSLIRDVAAWFKGLRDDSIGSWIEFSYAFVKYWGEYKSLDSYLADFYALKREQGEALSIFNRRFYSIYHDMPLKVRPTETTAMIHYVMCLHSELALLLLERKSSFLTQLFEDAHEVEENIRAAKWTYKLSYSENMYSYEQENCQYVSILDQEDSKYGSDFEHGDYECKAVCEQQRVCESISDSSQSFSIFVECSRNMYESECYDQFANQDEPMVTNDCISNYIFSTDLYSYDLDIVSSSCSDHFSEEKVIMINDHKLISRELEGDQSSSKGTVTAEREAAIDVQFFPEDQYVSDLCFQDPVAAFMESYISGNLKISDFFSSLMFTGEYSFLNEFYSLLLHFQHQLLSSDRDKVSSVLKLLGWLLWKSTFT